MSPSRTSRGRVTLFVALVLGSLTGCAPTFNKDGKSQEEFDRDNAQCIQESSTTTAARYGASHHTDWDAYARCMSTKGYSRR